MSYLESRKKLFSGIPFHQAVVPGAYGADGEVFSKCEAEIGYAFIGQSSQTELLGNAEANISAAENNRFVNGSVISKGEAKFNTGRGADIGSAVATKCECNIVITGENGSAGVVNTTVSAYLSADSYKTFSSSEIHSAAFAYIYN